MIDVVDLYTPQAERSDIGLTLSAAHYCMGCSEPDLLMAAQFNRVDNAIKFLPAGSLVRIELNGEGRPYHQLRIRDSAPAISDDA